MIAAAFLLITSLVQASPYITPEMDQRLMEGVDDIYRMRFDDAEAAAKAAIALNPEHPHPYMGLAGVTWTRYVYGTHQEDASLLSTFGDQTNKTIEVGEKWVKAHPDDAQGLMALGSAYGLSSRLAIIQHQWVRGYLQGRKAVQITRKAVAADPTCWDCYLGIGMYDYYTDVYPRFVGVLAKLVLRGDRLRGIKTLQMVADKGHYSQANAMILLVEIYLEDQWGARDPGKALALMKELRARYPDSAMMQEAEIEALYESGRYQDAANLAQDLVRKSNAGQLPSAESVKGYVMGAANLWQLGRLDEALESYRQAQSETFQGHPTRWAVWARIRAAQVQDLLGRRQEALADYRWAAGLADSWGLRRVAKAGLSAPYGERKPVGMDPPDE